MLHVQDTEKEHVLQHMGHSWDVHKIFYRQTSDVIERLDIAKLLLMQDQNFIAKLLLMQDQNLIDENRRKTLQEIELKNLTFKSKLMIVCPTIPINLCFFRNFC